jgi:microcystin-dependent protein
MAEPFLAEIRIMSFNFAPRGWALCNGQLLPINQNQALFSLLGTTYGGNGQTNFALPNLQGNSPLHQGQGLVRGEKGGSTAVTLTQQQMPQHIHTAQVRQVNGTSANPANQFLANVVTFAYRNNISNLTTIHPQTLTSAGGSQAHTNMMPYLVLNFCIALQGIFPSPT